MIVLVRNNCDSFDAYSSMTSRVMLKEFEDCIDDVMTILNDFIGCYKTLARFEEYRKFSWTSRIAIIYIFWKFHYAYVTAKHSELLVAVESLIICIRCCASYTWAMESRYGIVASRNEKSRISNTLIRTPETRDINIGSIWGEIVVLPPIFLYRMFCRHNLKNSQSAADDAHDETLRLYVQHSGSMIILIIFIWYALCFIVWII